MNPSAGKAAQPAQPLRVDVRPLYVQAEDSIRELVSALDLQPGDRLPSEANLARMLRISRSTVREALRHFELIGQVKRVHGLGTILMSPFQIVAGLETLESLESLAERQGWTCGTVHETAEAWTLQGADAEALRREEGAAAVRFLRTKTRDGDPVAFMESVLPADVVEPDDFTASVPTSIIDMFLNRGKPVLHHAQAHVRVESAPGEVATHLALRGRTPLLLLEEVFYDPNDEPFCANRNWFVPGSVRLDLIRRPR